MLDLTQTTLQEWALNNGLNANMKTMTQAEKTLLRYQYVMSNAKLAMGDFAATADTFANVTKTLKQQFQALGGIVGGVFINAFKPALIALRGFMQNVLDFAKTVADALGAIFGWTIEITASGGGGASDAFDDIADSVGDASDGAGNLSDGLGNAGKNAKDLADKLSVLPFDELNQLAKDTASSGSGSGGSGGSGGGGSGSGGTGGMSGSGANSSLVRTEAVFDKIKSDIGSLGELGEYISKVLTDALESIPWEDIYKAADNFGSGLAEFLNGLIKPELFSALGGTIAGAINTALHAGNAFAGAFEWTNLGDSIAAGVQRFFKDFDAKLAASTFNKFANGILDTMITAIGGVEWDKVGTKIGDALVDIDLEGIAKRLGTLISTKLSAVADFVENLKLDKLGTKIGKSINEFFTNLKLEEVGADIAKVGNSIVDFLYNAIDNIKFKDIGSEIAKGISKVFQDFDFKKLGATVGSLAEGILGFLNSAIEDLDSVSIGKGIVDFLTGINWLNVFTGAVKLVGNITNAFAGLLVGAVEGLVDAGIDLGKNIVDFLKENISEWPSIALDIVNGIFKGFADNAIGWANKVNEKIVKPFIDAFKSLFGIHSPSTVMEALGVDMMSGLFNGIKGMIEDVTGLFSGLLDSIKDFFKDPVGTIKLGIENGADLLSTLGEKAGVTDIVVNAKAKLDNTFENIFGKDGKGGFFSNPNAITDVVKSAGGGLIDSFKSVFGNDGLGGIFGKAKDDTATKTLAGKEGKDFSSIKTFIGAVGETVTKTLVGKEGSAFSSIKTYLSATSTDVTKKLFGTEKSGFGAIKTYVSAKSDSVMKKLFGKEKSGFGAIKTYTSAENKGVTAKIYGKEGSGYSKLKDFKNLSNKKVSASLTYYVSYKKAAGGGVYAGGRWHNIASYARGGYPDTSQLFIAREAGPELVGTLKGHTAVMNNNQIVASVSDGVAKAISSVQFHMQGYQAPEIDPSALGGVIEYAIASALSSNANERPIDVYATIKTQNDEVLARAVARGNKRLDYRANAVGT